MTADPHDPFARLAHLRHEGPVVVAHRGDSRNHPENTLAAFAAARSLGVAMQEFDVRASRDGVLVVIHDASVDRTTDGPRCLGPGALVAQLTKRELDRLDAARGSLGASPARVPSLTETLATLGPESIALVEHKAGTAAEFVAAIASERSGPRIVLQSFAWDFLREARRLAPTLPMAILGPTPDHAVCDRGVVDAALALGAGMVHWHDRGLGQDAVAMLHAAGLLVCSYTTDDELGWCGGAAMGFDAMCTNDPGRMLAWRAKRP